MKNKFSFLLIIGLLSLISCEPIGLCTKEFVVVSINITGKSLTQAYTVREKTKDTLTYSFYEGTERYTVLDDNFQSDLEDQQEEFIFVGKINDTIVIQEKFIIKADKCHIEKVSGPSKIDL